MREKFPERPRRAQVRKQVGEKDGIMHGPKMELCTDPYLDKKKASAAKKSDGDPESGRDGEGEASTDRYPDKAAAREKFPEIAPRRSGKVYS